MIIIHLYYERSKTKREIANNPHADPRKFACFLSCERKGNGFRDLLAICSSLRPGTRLNKDKGDSTDILFLPGPGHVSFPVTFRSITHSPMDGRTDIYFRASFEEIRHPEATVDLQNFMFVLMCAIESSWKGKSGHPGVLRARETLDMQEGWQKFGWEYGSGGSNPIDLLNDIADEIYGKSSAA